MRRPFETVGLTAALLFSGAACGEKEDSDSLSRYETEATVQAINDVSIYANPNAIKNPLGKVKIGEVVDIICYFTSVTLAMDSIKYISGEQTGFSFIGHYSDPDRTYVANFKPDIRALESIRDCEDGQDY